MKRNVFRKLITICAAVFMIAALSSAAFAMTIEEQMAANSAAWWVAHNAGDQATCDALHAANVALAAQLAGGSGTATYQYGSWEIDTDSGSHISSAEGSRDGINDIVNYSTTGNDGSISTVTDWSYTDTSIDAYYDYGGTNGGLITSYNNIGEEVSTSNEYGSESAKLSGSSEVAVVKALLGLTDAQAAQLQADLEASKQAFESAHTAYNEAKLAGDEDAMAAARAQMDAAHDAAQATRAAYNYTGDSSDYEDGGYYHGWGGDPDDPPDDILFFVVDVTPTFKIEATATGGGSISPSGSVTVKQNENATFIMTPDTGARLVSVTVDGRNVGNVSSYTFRNVRAAHTITAQFIKNSYTISASCNTGGSITPNGEKSVVYGGTQAYRITPNNGYRIKDVQVDGVSVGAVTSYTFRSIKDDHSIYAAFEKTSYTISASAGQGGRISPSGNVNVNTGSNATFTITPDTGWKISAVTVDGVNAGTVTNYTFVNVRENHTISASFSRLTYSISASAGAGGTISPSGTKQVTYGGSQTYTITAASGYEIDHVMVDGRSVGSVGTYTFSNVTESHTIAATFRVAAIVDVDTPTVSDTTGVNLYGRSIKSGYGITVNAPVIAQGVTNVQVVLTYDFGNGSRSVVMEASGSDYVLPVNSASPTGSRVIYIPVETADATYNITVTVSGRNAAGKTVTDTATSTVTVLGSMYEDDFTGDS